MERKNNFRTRLTSNCVFVSWQIIRLSVFWIRSKFSQTDNVLSLVFQLVGHFSMTREILNHKIIILGMPLVLNQCKNGQYHNSFPILRHPLWNKLYTWYRTSHKSQQGEQPWNCQKSYLRDVVIYYVYYHGDACRLITVLLSITSILERRDKRRYIS